MTDNLDDAALAEIRRLIVDALCRYEDGEDGAGTCADELIYKLFTHGRLDEARSEYLKARQKPAGRE